MTTDVFDGLNAVWEHHGEASPECPEMYYIRVSIEGPIPEDIRALKE